MLLPVCFLPSLMMSGATHSFKQWMCSVASPAVHKVVLALAEGSWAIGKYALFSTGFFPFISFLPGISPCLHIAERR